MPIESLEHNDSATEGLPGDTLDELRKRAYAAVGDAPGTPEKGIRNVYQRSRDVRDYVLARARGTCESCNGPAPFVRKNGTPYLEPHHTRRLSDGGPDDPRWVGAVCPTCHRKIHHGANGSEFNQLLQRRLQEIENTLGSS